MKREAAEREDETDKLGISGGVLEVIFPLLSACYQSAGHCLIRFHITHLIFFLFCVCWVEFRQKLLDIV